MISDAFKKEKKKLADTRKTFACLVQHTLGFEWRSLPRMVGPFHVLPPIAAKQAGDIFSRSSPYARQGCIPSLCKASSCFQWSGNAAPMAPLTVGEATKRGCE